MKVSAFVRHLGQVVESRWVACPWVPSFEVEIARGGLKAWKDWQWDQQTNSPIIMRNLNAKVGGTAEALTPADIASLKVQGEKTIEGVARHLVRGWRGHVWTDDETGEEGETPYSVAAAIELLSIDDVPMPPDDPDYGGMMLGAALLRWIQAESAKLEEYRASLESDAAKN